MDKLSSKRIAFWAPFVVMGLVHFRVLPELLPQRHWIFIDLCCLAALYEYTYVAQLIDAALGKVATVAVPTQPQAAPVPAQPQSKVEVLTGQLEAELAADEAAANTATAKLNASKSKVKAFAQKVA